MWRKRDKTSTSILRWRCYFRSMAPLTRILRTALVLLLLPLAALAAEIDRFVGTYEGQAEVDMQSGTEQRDMSVTIAPMKDGFTVQWTSVIRRSDGRTKEGTYEIEFVASPRENIYGSAMKTNVFGKTVPLDPLNGEPYVWARLESDTLSVYSLFINEVGEYEMQEYHRTLADDGLDLVFRRVHQGDAEKEIRTFLKRVN